MHPRTLRLALTAALLVAGVLVALVAGTGGSGDGDGDGRTASPASNAAGRTTLVEEAPVDGAAAVSAPAQDAPAGGTADGERPAAGTGGLDLVALSSLPAEAADTWELILGDGPFPYDRDGATFENREGILPDEPRGHYREYTVPTPGEDDRGARRLVVGGEPADRAAGADVAVFYTGDHYDSFVEVDTDR